MDTLPQTPSPSEAHQRNFLSVNPLPQRGAPKEFPISNPQGFRWVEGMGGEHEQWMAEEAQFVLEGGRDRFVNLRVRWKTAGLDEDAPIEIALGSHRGQTTYAELSRGLPLPIAAGRERLFLRSLAGTTPLHPPQDPRLASFLVMDPVVSPTPRYPLRWFSATEPGLLEDTVRFELTEGFYHWEENGAFIWSNSAATIETRSRQTRFLNVVVAGRYAPVAQGPLRIYRNEQEWLLDWPDGEFAFSLAVPGGRSSRIIVRNISGELSPQAVGESDDQRLLALRFTRISFDETPDFRVLEENP